MGNAPRLLVGTSGFSYKAWKGSFYPKDLPPGKLLSYYAEQMPAVEINNTFYRMPQRTVMAKWRTQVPPEFRFVLKASRRITHHSRLKDAGDSLLYLLDVAAELGDRLGALLFQLPPYLKKDVVRLREFCSLLPRQPKAAFEFRHQSWFDDEVFTVLADADASLCIADAGAEDRDAPWVATASWGYLRLRRENYEEADLASWAERIDSESWSDAYVFFKHEEAGVGPKLATQLLDAYGRA